MLFDIKRCSRVRGRGAQAAFAGKGNKALDNGVASTAGAFDNILMNGQEVFRFAVRAVPAVRAMAPPASNGGRWVTSAVRVCNRPGATRATVLQACGPHSIARRKAASSALRRTGPAPEGNEKANASVVRGGALASRWCRPRWRTPNLAWTTWTGCCCTRPTRRACPASALSAPAEPAQAPPRSVCAWPAIRVPRARGAAATLHVALRAHMHAAGAARGARQLRLSSP